jgi:hypothetical protein
MLSVDTFVHPAIRSEVVMSRPQGDSGSASSSQVINGRVLSFGTTGHLLVHAAPELIGAREAHDYLLARLHAASRPAMLHQPQSLLEKNRAPSHSLGILLEFLEEPDSVGGSIFGCPVKATSVVTVSPSSACCKKDWHRSSASREVPDSPSAVRVSVEKELRHLKDVSGW